MYVRMHVGIYIWDMCKHFSLGELEPTVVGNEDQKGLGQRNDTIRVAFWEYPLVPGHY